MTPQVSLPSLQGGSPRKAIARRRRARLHAVLLATSALASVALAAAANAADATWSGATNDYNAAANWNAAPGDGDTATFTAAGVTKDVVFSQDFTGMGGWSVTGGNYTFDVNGHLLFVEGDVSIQNGASATIIVSKGGMLDIDNAAVGQANIRIDSGIVF